MWLRDSLWEDYNKNWMKDQYRSPYKIKHVELKSEVKNIFNLFNSEINTS